MTKSLQRLYAETLILIFVGIVIHTPLTIWLGTVYPSGALWIKSWKEIMMFILALIAVWLVTYHKLWRELAKDWLFRIVAAYGALHLVLAVVWWHGTNQTLAGLGIDLRYILFFALVYLLVKIAPSYKKIMVNVAVGGALVITGFATIQYFLPADILKNIGYSDQTIKPYQTVDRNPNYVRVNSTLRGPNPLGAYAAATLAMIAAYVATRKQKKLPPMVGLMGLTSVVALWLSYSRSAIVAAFVGIGAAFALGMKKFSPILWKTGVVALLLVLGLLVIGKDSAFVHNVILHDDPAVIGVKSNQAHVSSLQEGTDRLLRQPLGAGIGTAGSASLLGAKENGLTIESQYLFIAHESGWLGLGLYIALFSLVLWRAFTMRREWLPLGVVASGITLAIIGILLPVWTDDAVSIIWWGIAALAVGGGYGKNHKNKQKTA